MLSHEDDIVHGKAKDDEEPHPEDDAHWSAFATLMCVTSLAGIVYAGILNFLPRYLDATGLDLGIPRKACEIT